MKHFLLFTLFLLLCNLFTEAQQTPTDAGIPEAQQVLVVYNFLSDTSRMVKDYYQQKRGIPESNICPLENLSDQNITIDGTTHRIKIVQETDIIQDSVNNANHTATPTIHAWKYFLNYVSTPIKNWISSHNLSIRYILLLKGVPCKIQAAGDWFDAEGNISTDGLLCILNTENYDSLIMNEVYPVGLSVNPYFDVDPNLTMDYRFMSDHFTSLWHSHIVKLSYLVSHLDGINYNIVKGMIDRAIDPDMSGNATWVLDDDPTYFGYGYLNSTRDKMEELGFNIISDTTNAWVTNYNGSVMGYTSWGTHAPFSALLSPCLFSLILPVPASYVLFPGMHFSH